jgi:hypothetical protein
LDREKRFDQILQMAVWRQSGAAFLTTRVNHPVSTPGLGAIPPEKQRKSWKQSK